MTPRIVHVASGREWRGGQRQVWLLARALARLGLEQVVVTGRASELARRVRAAGVPVRAAAWRLGLDPRVLGPILREVRHPGSILHAHDAHAVTLAGLAAQFTGTPLVVTRRVDFPLRRLGYWGRAQRVIAISHAVAAILKQDGILPERITVVHSGVSLDAVRTTIPLGIRGRLGLRPDTLIAANVAALVPHKDHATLVAAAGHLVQRFPDLHWVIAGDGELRAALEELVSAAGLRAQVHLVGHIDDPLRLIADADLFVMSSRKEGLGTSVLDAMALGIPVASTSAGGLPEMLGNGAGLMVPPGDGRALGEAVARLLEDSGLRSQIAEQGKADVLRFTDARMADALATVYRSCIHSLDGS